MGELLKKYIGPILISLLNIVLVFVGIPMLFLFTDLVYYLTPRGAVLVVAIILAGMGALQIILFTDWENSSLAKLDKKKALSLNEVKKILPDCDYEKFLFYRYKDYLEIERFWTHFDYEKLRTKVTDEVFNQYSMQLDVLKSKNQRNILQGFDLVDDMITEVKDSNNQISVTIELLLNFYDYIMEGDKIVSGSSTMKVWRRLRMTFVKDKVVDNIETCPNCGAKFDGFGTQVCKYCDSVVVRGNNNWLLAKKEIVPEVKDEELVAKIDKLVELDHTFSESSFISKVDNTFVMLFSSAIDDNFAKVRHKLSPSLYEKILGKFKNSKNKELIKMYGELNIKNTYIKDVIITDDKYIIYVDLIGGFIDNRIDSDTKRYIEWKMRHTIERKWDLVFEKKRNFSELENIKSCPGCGANIDSNCSGECQYCHTIYNLEDYDWILTEIN